MKYLKFNVTESTERTFEIPLDEVKRVLDSYKVDYSTWNEDEMAEELYNFYFDDIEKCYEKDNYFESNVQDVEIEEFLTSCINTR